MEKKLDSALSFYLIFVKLAGNQDRPKISKEFKFRLDQSICFEVTCPWALKNTIIDQWKWCLHDSAFSFDRIFLKLAGNKDRHKFSDKFDFGLGLTICFGVTCPWATIFFLQNYNWENVNRIGPSLLIGSSSNLQVTRIGMKSQKSFNSGQIRFFTSLLLALECRKTVYLTLFRA